MTKNCDISVYLPSSGNTPWGDSIWGKYQQLSLLDLIALSSPVSAQTLAKSKSYSRQAKTSHLPKQQPQGPNKRRMPGQGSGYIQLHYCEKMTRSGKKSYEQYYYHYELGSGSKRIKRSIYIPKSKLNVVMEWDRQKTAVSTILSYLGKR